MAWLASKECVQQRCSTHGDWVLLLACSHLQLWPGLMHWRPLVIHAALGAGVQAHVGRGKGGRGRRKERGEREEGGGGEEEAPCSRNRCLQSHGHFLVSLSRNRAQIEALDSPGCVEHVKQRRGLFRGVLAPPQPPQSHPLNLSTCHAGSALVGGQPALACCHSYKHHSGQ